MNDIKLKSCPFCGSNGVRYTSYNQNKVYDESGYKIHTIRCNQCGANIDRLDKNEVILAWNKREGK